VPALDLLVVGDCNPDLILSGADVAPAFGQVERLVDHADLTIGGSAAIVACGAARLGLRTALVASVGADALGDIMLASLTDRGVDVSGCRIGAGVPTGVTVVLSHPGDRAILTFPGAVLELAASDVDPALVGTARHVHVSSYFLQPGLAPGLPDLFRRAHAAGATVSLDTNWDPAETWDGGVREALAHVDVFLPNAAEAAAMTGLDDPEQAAAELSELGPTVVVKLGAEGALAVHEGRTFRSAAPRVATVDTTGAGDEFAAGFLAGTLGGRSLQQSLTLACACASLSTLALGGVTAQPTLEEALAAVPAVEAG
jgi:sugar/nucleoside kinase (ribokinase family)